MVTESVEKILEIEQSIASLARQSDLVPEGFDIKIALVISRDRQDRLADYIIEYVCRKLGVNPAALSRRTKKQEIVDARAVCAYMLYQYTKMTYIKIDQKIRGGDGDHTVICHWLNRSIPSMMFIDDTKKTIHEIRTHLEEKFGF